MQAAVSRCGPAAPPWPWPKSASTSARCGAAKAPPKRVHFSAAAAEANRSASRSSCFSVMASAKAPWNTSPAPSVSTVWTGKAGVSCSSPRSSSQIVPCGPARPRQERWRQLCDFFQRLAVVGDSSAVSCSGSLENTRCEEAVRRPSRSDIARSTSTITGMPRRTRFGAEVGAEFGAAALGQDGVRNPPAASRGRGRLHLPQFRIAEGDDGALAGRIDHDGRDRRHQARHVHEVLGRRCPHGPVFRRCSGSMFRVRRPSARRSRRGRRAARFRSRH